jgi:hypothetical protein
MGYRSDVAYVIRFKTTEQRDAYMELVKHRNDEHMMYALEDCESRYEEPIITFEVQDVKWYPDYPEVKGHSKLMAWAVETFPDDASWRCVELGEDNQEEVHQGGEDPSELYDYVNIRHTLTIDFPQVISTTTEE